MTQPRSKIRRLAHAGKVLAGAGLVKPERPSRLVKTGIAFVKRGPTPATGAISGGLRFPDEPSVIDERGTLTFREVDGRTNAIARSLAAQGVAAGDGVAIMCRNHRGWVEAVVATSKLGANALLLNTGFAGPQLAEVCEREGPAVVIHDEEFTELLAAAVGDRMRVIAWHDDPVDGPTLDTLAEGDRSPVPVPAEQGRTTILTSGTTGTPKGAQRSNAGLGAAVSLLSVIPLQRRMTVSIPAPLFHAWGYAHFQLGLLLGSTYLLRHRFDPEACLADIERHRPQALVVVPVMLQRILELPEDVRSRYDTSSLEVVAASGSALPGELAQRWMDAFGDNLYNLYGSTEVAWATIATPADLRAAPGTAGRPPVGTELRLYDDRGQPLPTGEVGRIFVGNEHLFEGYTGGGDKERIDGLMATGDVGKVDGEGRLFVEGRDDEMIVSGGENVFPQEVEEALVRHPAVVEAAAVGVEDEQFGQRLRAFVVADADATATEDDLKAHVRSELARYKVPREIVFLPELPRTSTGKVLKRELRDQAAS